MFVDLRGLRPIRIASRVQEDNLIRDKAVLGIARLVFLLWDHSCPLIDQQT